MQQVQGDKNKRSVFRRDENLPHVLEIHKAPYMFQKHDNNQSSHNAPEERTTQNIVVVTTHSYYTEIKINKNPFNNTPSHVTLHPPRRTSRNS